MNWKGFLLFFWRLLGHSWSGLDVLFWVVLLHFSNLVNLVVDHLVKIEEQIAIFVLQVHPSWPLDLGLTFNRLLNAELFDQSLGNFSFEIDLKFWHFFSGDRGCVLVLYLFELLRSLKKLSMVKVDSIDAIELIGWDEEAFIDELIDDFLLNLFVLYVHLSNHFVDVARVS